MSIHENIVCPSFCELSEHHNLGTTEHPSYVHETEDHIVHGVRVRVSTVTNARGVEVADDALSVVIDDEPRSLQQARDIAHAIFGAVTQAELSDPEVQRLFDESGPIASARMARAMNDTNHAKHLYLQAERSRTAS